MIWGALIGALVGLLILVLLELDARRWRRRERKRRARRCGYIEYRPGVYLRQRGADDRDAQIAERGKR